MPFERVRSDRCPGAFRPWQAEDGLLVRLRLIGGRITAESLLSVAEVSERFGDGRVHVTSRANLQVRAFAGSGGRLDDAALTALERTGLLPTRTHELVRNIMVSPLSGYAGGRANVRTVASELDRTLCADPALADLPARFLFVLDDGRGDLMERSCDLGLTVLDDRVCQLRVGTGWSDVVPLSSAADRLAHLASTFARARGTGPTAPWHIAELSEPLTPLLKPDPRLPAPIDPLPFGDVRGGRHIAVPETGLDREAIRALAASAAELIVTPWRGLFIPEKRIP